MSRFTRIFEMLDIIFGKGFMSKNIGKRTNVITLPDENSRRLLTKELAIDKAPDSAIQQGKKDLEKLALDIPKLNDQELLTLTNNAERLAARINPKEFIKRRQRALPKADVIEFANKEKISPEGVMSLTEKIGQKNAPGTLMGNLESRIKQLEASGEDLSKLKGKTYDEIMGDVASSQQGMRQLEKQGLVRATARDIITSDIKSGKLKLPKELEQQILEGGGEPIDVLRNVYGEDALEVLDSLIPEFSKLRTSTEAEKLARSKFKFEPDVNRPKGSMSLEEAKKAEQENILTPKKPEEPEEFATGGRVGFNEGSKLTDYLKTNISAKTSSSSPEEGVKVKQEILDGIISLNIPLSKKLKLLGDLKFGKNRAKVDLSELGKKYGIDLGEEVYKDKYFSPGLGAEYTTDEGTKFNLMVNPEDKGGSISVSRSFATGGRVGYQAGGVTTKGIVEVIPKNLPQTLSEAIKQFGREAVYGKVISSGGGDEPEYRAPGLNQYYNSMSLEDPYEAGRLKEQYRPAIGPAGTVLPLKTTPTPAEQLQTTYTANVTPSTSSGLYPNNPFYSSTFGVPTESVQPKTSKLYPNNPFYFSTFGVPTEEDTSKEMSSDISVLYDQYMKNLGYQSGGRVGYSDGTKPSAEENTPSQEIINRMIAQIKQLSKRGVDVNTIKDIVGASDQMIKDVLGKASGGSMSKGLDYLTGIERRGYANGDYVVQAGIKNYLGKQKTATVPIKWKSGKGDSHPDTELAYITKPEKDLLLKLDMHNSMPDGEPNIGPGGLISLNSGGDGGAGGGGGGDGGSTDTGDQGSEAANDAASASAAASASGSSGTDTADMGSEAANVSSTSSGAASVGSGSSGTDTADMGSEAANVSSTSIRSCILEQVIVVVQQTQQIWVVKLPMYLLHNQELLPLEQVIVV
jgi:hypothetical protein